MEEASKAAKNGLVADPFSGVHFKEVNATSYTGEAGSGCRNIITFIPAACGVSNPEPVSILLLRTSQGSKFRLSSEAIKFSKDWISYHEFL